MSDLSLLLLLLLLFNVHIKLWGEQKDVLSTIYGLLFHPLSKRDGTHSVEGPRSHQGLQSRLRDPTSPPAEAAPRHTRRENHRRARLVFRWTVFRLGQLVCCLSAARSARGATRSDSLFCAFTARPKNKGKRQRK